MLITPNSRVERIQAAVKQLTDDTLAREKAAAAARIAALKEMSKKVGQFFGKEVREPSDLHLEGEATRALLKKYEKPVCFYTDIDRNRTYLLDNNGSIAVGYVDILVGGEDIIEPQKLAEWLVEKNVSFDEVLKNVRAEVDKILDEIEAKFSQEPAKSAQTQRSVTSDQSPMGARSR